MSEHAASAREQQRALWSLLRFLRPHRLLFTVSTTLAGLNQLAGIATAGIGAVVVGLAATGASRADITPWVYALAVLVPFTAIAAWLEMWLVHDIAYRILADLRAELYRAMARLAPAYFVDRRSGDVAATAMADVETLEWFFAHTVGAVLIIAVVPPCVLAVLFWIDPWLPVLLLPLVVAVAVVPAVFAKRAARQGAQLRTALGRAGAETIDALQGLRELTIFDQKGYWFDLLQQRSQQLAAARVAFGRRDGLEAAAAAALSAFGMFTVLVAAARLTAAGTLQPALFPACVILAGAMFVPVTAMSRIVANLGNVGAAAVRVETLLHAEPTVKDRQTRPPATHIHPDLRFEDVSFRYSDDAPWVLRGVSFQVTAGETVALVGLSGSGKSTLAQLALRFWDPQQGRITLGTHDIVTFPRQSLNQHLMLLPQTTTLFDCDLRENIRLGDESADDAAVEQAARWADAEAFIQALPDGYATHAGDRGAHLSGGQRQRIALARALLRRPPVLILDESLSQLDSATEALVLARIREARAGQTTLFIAHRPATVRHCDRILLFQTGRLIADGSWQDLHEQVAAFRHLIHSQPENDHPPRGVQP